MPKRSKALKLSDEFQKLIGQLWKAGHSLDDIMAHLCKLDPESDISRSGLHRHIQARVRPALEMMEQSRAAAQAIMERLGDKPESDQSRLNLELMHALMFKLLVPDGANEITLDLKQAYFLAKSLQALSSAEKSNTDNAIKLREKFADEQKQKLEKAVDKGEMTKLHFEKAMQILGFRHG